VNLVAVMLIAIGMVAFVRLTATGHLILTPRRGWAAALFLAVLSLSLALHELGHALTVQHAGRRVMNAGFRLYLGNPCLFIDSSDLLLAPARARAVNAFAGVYVEAVLAAVASLVAWVGIGGSLCCQFAAITYLNILVNLVPFIELDGYWLLSDLLEIPRLRPRAMSLLRRAIPDRACRRRSRLTRREWAFTCFGVVSLVFTATALAAAWLLWWPIAHHLTASLWASGPWGRTVLGLLSVLAVTPLLGKHVQLAHAIKQHGTDACAGLRFRAQTRWRVEAAEAISRVRPYDRLDEDTLSELAGRVTLRRMRALAIVYEEGEPAEGLYVVRRGTFTITHHGLDNDNACLEVGPGEAFGSAELQAHRRRTTTAQASTAGQLFVVDADTFQRFLAPAISPPHSEGDEPCSVGTAESPP